MLPLIKPTKEQWIEIITVIIKTIGVLLLMYLFLDVTGLLNLLGNK